jgi:hypothetical protein
MKATILLLVVLALGVVISGCVSTETGTGKLVLHMTDKPGLNIESAVVTISKVQVHVDMGNNESGWYTVVEGPKTFDLVQIKDVKAYLGEANLSVGIYTQIRLDVDSAVVTINGTEYNLTIPSKTVKMVRSFEIKEGETITLTLDFDAQESIHEDGANKYIMRPTIQVLSESELIEKEEKELTPTKEELCTSTGGTVVTAMCCNSVEEEFPNTCLVGACGCSPENSHEINTCDCGEGKCFDGEKCTAVEQPSA